MDDTLVKYLEQLELSILEAKIYLILLETGTLSARDIINKLGIYRTTVYTHLDSLYEKGLITKIKEGSRTLFAPTESEEALHNIILRKKQNLQEIETKFPDIIKNFLILHSNKTEKTEAEARFYKGRAGVQQIYKEAVQAKELRSYANLSEIEKVFPENFKLFDDAFKKNPDIEMFEIIENTPFATEKAKIAWKNGNKRYHYKFFSKNRKITSTDILIYDGKVSFINLKNTISCVVLRNADLYENFKILFDSMWEMLPDDI
jgi:sugar-specific transcriptional regulator TrmB